MFARSSLTEGSITIGSVTADVSIQDLEALSNAINHLEATFLTSDVDRLVSAPPLIVAESKWDAIDIRASGSYTLSMGGIRWDVSRGAVLNLRTLLRDILSGGDELPKLAMAA